MKKIIVLSGSPRKKDGYRLIKSIEERLSDKDAIDLEYIRTSDIKIHDCVGCMRCFEKGEEYCPFKEETQELVDKLVTCDAIIFHSPVYALSITGSMKSLIDRMAYLFHRPELIGKPAITLVTTGGGGIKQTQDFLKMVARGFGCNLVGELSIISPLYYEESNLYNEKYSYKLQQKLESVVENLHKSIHRVKPFQPSYKDLYMFHGLRSKTYLSHADYKYWDKKGWLDSNYYYDVKLSYFKLLFGKTLDLLIKAMIKKYMGDNKLRA